jgi:hypothetical protein
MVAIADVLAKVALEASKEPEPVITAMDFAEMVTIAARALHQGLTGTDVRWVRNNAMAALAVYAVECCGARIHADHWDTVGAWLAGVSGEEARTAIEAAGLSLRAGVLR